jgi:hypothetical protein
MRAAPTTSVRTFRGELLRTLLLKRRLSLPLFRLLSLLLPLLRPLDISICFQHEANSGGRAGDSTYCYLLEDTPRTDRSIFWFGRCAPTFDNSVTLKLGLVDRLLQPNSKLHGRSDTKVLFVATAYANIIPT